MNYNIHPLFVHVPIALLCIYSILVIFPFKKWFPRIAWKDIERTFLSIGIVGAFFALGTGETAEHLTRPSHQIVEAHSMFAAIATWLYGALLLGEVCAVINKYPAVLLGRIPVLQKVLVFIEQHLTHSFFASLVAFIALIAMGVTGLLGGVMVHGVSADPLAPYILRILGSAP